MWKINSVCQVCLSSLSVKSVGHFLHFTLFLFCLSIRKCFHTSERFLHSTHSASPILIVPLVLFFSPNSLSFSSLDSLSFLLFRFHSQSQFPKQTGNYTLSCLSVVSASAFSWRTAMNMLMRTRTAVRPPCSKIM